MARRASPPNLVAWRRKAIRTMEASRRATLRFLRKLPENEILRPRTMSRWSVKDVLAHIVAWEQEAVKRLEQIARGQGDRIVFYDSMTAADRFNARAVARTRRTSLGALLRQATRVRRRLLADLRRLPPISLNDPAQRWPVVAWLPEFAWTHEQDHLGRLRAWWREQSSRQRHRSRTNPSDQASSA